jgi:hypothetical protein
VAPVRPSGGFNGHLDVWIVHGIFIRRIEQNVQGSEDTQAKLIHFTRIFTAAQLL